MKPQHSEGNEHTHTLTLAELCLAIGDGEIPVEQRGESFVVRNGDVGRYCRVHGKEQTHQDRRPRPFVARSA